MSADERLRAGRRWCRSVRSADMYVQYRARWVPNSIPAGIGHVKESRGNAGDGRSVELTRFSQQINLVLTNAMSKFIFCLCMSLNILVTSCNNNSALNVCTTPNIFTGLCYSINKLLISKISLNGLRIFYCTCCGHGHIELLLPCFKILDFFISAQ